MRGGYFPAELRHTLVPKPQSEPPVVTGVIPPVAGIHRSGGGIVKARGGGASVPVVLTIVIGGVVPL